MTATPSTAFPRLVELLKELFEFDKAELDFGIYRVLNERRAEVSQFLEHDLLPAARAALAQYAGAERTDLEAQLADLEDQLRKVGVALEDSAKYRDLRAALAESTKYAALEDEVYSDLYRFFRRYYKDGDFYSLRRYKEGVYALPYEGEETKFYWANYDQYYVKSSEAFRNYRFRLKDGRHVHFRIATAASDPGNNKRVEGRERRFVLRDTLPAEVVDDELVAYFDYVENSARQAELNKQAVAKLLDLPDLSGWRIALVEPEPTPANPGRTVLDRHLNDYTARNTFDYFIHRDLGVFLRRELDFFLKNEVLHVDDLDGQDERHLGSRLAKLRAIKQIALRVIEFLAQLEDFQKKLWLKRKIVLRN